ncbi:MAG: hypothetical protein LPK14_02910 [Hymenobacteraceae bacterium]|nr:hypothetical protein [Hymenobacteraceae bacterium]
MSLKKWLPGLLMSLLFLLLAILLQLLKGARPLPGWLPHRLAFFQAGASGMAQEESPGKCRDPASRL